MLVSHGTSAIGLQTGLMLVELNRTLVLRVLGELSLKVLCRSGSAVRDFDFADPNVTISSDAIVDSSVWHHVAMTFNASWDIAIYINGMSKFSR